MDVCRSSLFLYIRGTNRLYPMEEVRQNSVRAWLLAARPKTLAAAVAPVAVGCALAYYFDAFQWVPALCCLLFAVAMQIAANLINDL